MNLEIVNIYLFVGSAIFAIIPVVIIFKILAKRLIERPGQYNQVQKNLFIGIAMSKIVPVIVLIFAILRMPSGIDFNMLIIPYIIIIASVIVCFLFISSHKRLQTEPEAKRAVNTLIMVTRPHLFSIPLMAIVFLYLMTF